MRNGLIAVAVVGGVGAFGAAGLSLLLLGLGVPYLVGAVLSALCAGLLVYAVGRWAALGASPDYGLDAAVLAEQVHLIGESSAHLRHDLRGVLSPALMVADRLLTSSDPGIRRAGEAVVRSVERATALLVENKRSIAAATGAETPVEAAPPPARHADESVAPRE